MEEVVGSIPTRSTNSPHNLKRIADYRTPLTSCDALTPWIVIPSARFLGARNLLFLNSTQSRFLAALEMTILLGVTIFCKPQ